jgi:hypothetical protein
VTAKRQRHELMSLALHPRKRCFAGSKDLGWDADNPISARRLGKLTPMGRVRGLWPIPGDRLRKVTHGTDALGRNSHMSTRRPGSSQFANGPDHQDMALRWIGPCQTQRKVTMAQHSQQIDNYRLRLSPDQGSNELRTFTFIASSAVGTTMIMVFALISYLW